MEFLLNSGFALLHILEEIAIFQFSIDPDCDKRYRCIPYIPVFVRSIHQRDIVASVVFSLQEALMLEMGLLGQTIKEAFLVVLAALALAVLAGLLRPNIAPHVQHALPKTPTGQSDSKTIDFKTAVAHFNNGTAVFADARAEAAYAAGHIEGALFLDPHRFDEWSEQIFGQLDADGLIITYCDGASCTLGLELMEKLNWLGFENVRHLSNGWTQWVDAQMPIDRGAP